MNKKIELKGNDWLTYYNNHFLSTPEGQSVLEKVFGDNKEFKEKIQNQLKTHKKILGLGDEAPMEGQSVPIPQNFKSPLNKG